MTAPIDPTSEVVVLCSRGMEAELAGEVALAASCFRGAWQVASSAHERCIAAHYLARVQPDTAERHAWNGRALDEAIASGDAAVAFLPSLHVSLGLSYEELSDPAVAHAHFVQAVALSESLGSDDYGDLVRRGAADGVERTRAAAEPPGDPGRK